MTVFFIGLVVDFLFVKLYDRDPADFSQLHGRKQQDIAGNPFVKAGSTHGIFDFNYLAGRHFDKLQGKRNPAFVFIFTFHQVVQFRIVDHGANICPGGTKEKDRKGKPSRGQATEHT